MTDPDFPNSYQTPFLITSAKSWRYNCIAYVYGDLTRPYWPVLNLAFYWPPQLQRVEHLDSFIDLYETVGYSTCPDGNLQPEFEKIAIFGLDENRPKHAALQLLDGNWSSKLGANHDVSHTIQSISGGAYGHVLCYMRRPRKF